MFALLSIHSISSVSLNGDQLLIGGEDFTFSRQQIDEADPNQIAVTVIIEGKYTEIPDNAFQYLSNIKNVSITAPIATIGESAFEGCSNLIFIELPHNSPEIKQSAFANTSIKSLNLQVSKIEMYTFTNSNIKTISLEKVERIQLYAFANCSHLKKITLSNLLAFVGECCFANCTSLESIQLDNVKRLLPYTFYNCKSLNSISLSNELIKIYDYALSYTQISSISLAPTTGYIGNGAFEECSKLSQISISEAVYFIGASAFKGTLITSIQLPAKVTHIPSSVFENCKNLQKCVILGDLDSIEEKAFMGCTSLQEMVIIGSVSKIDQTAFSGCQSLKKFYFCADQINDKNMSLFESNVTIFVPSSYNRTTFFGLNVTIDKSGTCPSVEPDNKSGITTKQRNWIIIGTVLVVAVLSGIIIFVSYKAYQAHKRRFDSITSTLMLGNV